MCLCTYVGVHTNNLMTDTEKVRHVQMFLLLKNLLKLMLVNKILFYIIFL